MKLSKMLLKKAGSKFTNIGYGMKEMQIDNNTHILVNIDVDVVTVYLSGYVHVEFIPNGKRRYNVKYTCGYSYDMGTVTVSNNGNIIYRKGKYAPSYLTGYDVKRAVNVLQSVLCNSIEKEVVHVGWLQ